MTGLQWAGLLWFVGSLAWGLALVYLRRRRTDKKD